MNKKLLYSYAVIFIIMSLFMGKMLNFYGIVPFWDKTLHFLSGFILYPWGLYLFYKLKGDKDNQGLKVVFGILFCLSCALLWEVWEFAGDSVFGLKSQNNSLSDTMWDMIVACPGAIVSVFFHRK